MTGTLVRVSLSSCKVSVVGRPVGADTWIV